MSQAGQSCDDVSPRGQARAAARTALALAALALAFGRAPVVAAAEAHSNSLGGGDWSDPASWREKTVPGDKDQAVISRGDVIEFDRNDEGKITCQQIYIDPKGTLGFKSGMGRVVCRVAGQVEVYGAIKVDASRSAADHFELQLIGSSPGQRTIKLLKNASLVVSGRHGLAHGKHNAAIGSPAVEGQEPELASVEAGAVSMVDLRAAELFNIHVAASNIDNTGAKANERLNILESHLSGASHLSIRNCDSPTIADNLFEASGAAGSVAAILVEGCPLADIHGNVVRGRYSFGISGHKQVDSAVIGNVVENCATGIFWRGKNVMIKKLALRGCDTGLTLSGATGVVEDLRIERCRQPVFHEESETQFTDSQITDVPAGGAAVSLNSGTINLLNCNLKPEQFALPNKGVRGPKKRGPVVVQCMDYLIAHVQGRAPAGAVVVVHTLDPANPPVSGAPDPNVRNSPAKILPSGLTPLPVSLEPLIVKSWALERGGETLPAPRYTVSVVSGAAKPRDGKPADANPAGGKPLASLEASPDASWFRPEPNAAKPTLEITLP